MGVVGDGGGGGRRGLCICCESGDDVVGGVYAQVANWMYLCISYHRYLTAVDGRISCNIFKEHLDKAVLTRNSRPHS